MALKQKVMKGFFWAFLERGSTQIVGFVISMILARLLTPTDYGTVALLSIFIALTGVIVNSGLGTALIQKKEATELDFNSVFYLSIIASSIGYTVLFFIARWIARYYAIPILVPILRIQALSLLFGAIAGVQGAILSRNLLFHLSFKINVISSVIQAFLGIGLALGGYGVWALVWSSLGTSIVSVGAQWFFIGWRPKWMFSWYSVRTLFGFGWKMSISALLDTGYNNLYGLLIGKFYSPADLAFVNKGQAIPSMAMGSINGTLGRVAFPA
ncbi:MAG: oligosaccharide flippase family protein, partial [Kiritimatiellia bacterium]